MNKNSIFNNNGITSPVIIYAECRAKCGIDNKLIPYNCITGMITGSPFRVTIHNYESDALGFDPMIQNEQNYHYYIYLSALLNFPWGLEVKFRDNDGIVFDAGDIIRLLGERSEEVMKKWEEGNVEFKKKQDEVVSKLNIKHRSSTSEPSMPNQDIMEI